MSAESLGLRPAPIATQVIQRDIHAEFMSDARAGRRQHRALGHRVPPSATHRSAGSRRAFHQGPKRLQRHAAQAQSHHWERLTGLARVLRGNAIAALENVALWHERDISHSSVERIIFPDSCTLLDYMFGTAGEAMDGLHRLSREHEEEPRPLARHVELPDRVAGTD